VPDQKPSVGRIVHYVSYGTPGGEYTSQCRAAVVTGVGEPLEYPVHGDGVDDLGPDDAQLVDLCVLNPTGLFFNQGVPQDELPASEKILPGDRRTHNGGTWHWPERV
jgi:hypothetical protein